MKNWAVRFFVWACFFVVNLLGIGADKHIV